MPARTYFVTPFVPSAYGEQRGACLWAERPTTRNNIGDTLKITDRGSATYTWTGSVWVAQPSATAMSTTERFAPVIVSQGAIPVILGNMSTAGISATTGAFSLDTALPAAYTAAGAWMFLPAGAIVGGLAGFYYCTFTTTQAGIVKKNSSGSNLCYISPDATAFTPTVPAGTLTFAVGAAAIWTATASADIALLNSTISANMMGASGKVKVSYQLATSNSVNAKAIKISFGAFSVLSTTTTTGVALWVTREISNVTTAAQVTASVDSLVEGAVGAAVRGTVNTTADVALKLFGQLHATDAGAGFIILEAFSVQVLPGA